METLICNKTEESLKNKTLSLISPLNVISWSDRWVYTLFFCVTRCQASALTSTDSTNKSTSVPQGNNVVNFATGGQEVSSLQTCWFFLFFTWYSDLSPTPPHQGPQCVILWKKGPRGALLQEASWFRWITATLLCAYVHLFKSGCILNLLLPHLFFMETFALNRRRSFCFIFVLKRAIKKEFLDAHKQVS